MDLELKGKVAIIGGASKGLGIACAQILAEEGAKITICSRTEADLQQAAAEIRDTTGAEVLVIPADLESHESIKSLIATTVDHYGHLDIMVNNSGGPPLARSYDATEEQWETAVQRSLFFFARMSREAVPHLKAQGGGRIINILASTVYQPIPNLALSGATRMVSWPLPKAWPMRWGGMESWSTMYARVLSSASACCPTLLLALRNWAFPWRRRWLNGPQKPQSAALANRRSWRIWWLSWLQASPAM